jgi:hypothetical protein
MLLELVVVFMGTTDIRIIRTSPVSPMSMGLQVAHAWHGVSVSSQQCESHGK